MIPPSRYGPCCHSTKPCWNKHPEEWPVVGGGSLRRNKEKLQLHSSQLTAYSLPTHLPIIAITSPFFKKNKKSSRMFPMIHRMNSNDIFLPSGTQVFLPLQILVRSEEKCRHRANRQSINPSARRKAIGGPCKASGKGPLVPFRTQMPWRGWEACRCALGTVFPSFFGDFFHEMKMFEKKTYNEISVFFGIPIQSNK